MKKTAFLILLALSSISFGTYVFTSDVNVIGKKLAFYMANDFPEKVYVQTDKSIYTSDETIWFASYLVNGIYHTKSNRSSVVNVELINEQDSIVDRKKLYVENISEAGDFKISKNWKPGKYLLRAYTNDMRNNGTDYFFRKDIWIWSSEKSIEEKENLKKNGRHNTAKTPRLSFYPEGGYLVQGISNKVAVKFRNHGVDDSNIAGEIYDNEGVKVLDFNIYQFGLGQFSLNPEWGKTYFAHLNIDGNIEQYALPKPLSKGYVISAVNNGDRIAVNVSSSMSLGLKGTFLVAHQRGELVFQKIVKEDKTKYSISLPTNKLDDGVVHLTLFDSSGRPVSERLLFVQNKENSTRVNIEKNRSALSTRQKLTLTLSAKDFEGQNVSGNFSMAVRDLKASNQGSYEDNIKTWLLLNSDLRGEIENPAYFFEPGDEIKKRFLLDLVMRTNGWRRFTWNELLHKPRTKKKHEIEKGIFITGKTISLKRPNGPISAPTRLTFLTRPPHQETQQSDNKGAFSFGPYMLFDSVPALLEARSTSFGSEKQRDRKVLILIDENNDFPAVTSNKNVTIEEDEEAVLQTLIGVTNYLEQVKWEYGDQVNELDEVVVTAKLKSEMEKRNDEMNERTIYGEPSNRVVTEDLHGAEWRTVIDLLRTQPGVQISGSSISIRGGGTPAFFLDGMEIDSTYIETLAGSEIEFIDILRGADAAIFPNSSNGVIALYSKVGSNINSYSVKRSPGIIDFSSRGFYVARKFYAPDHVHGFEEQVKADIRTTLHWEPDIRIKDDDSIEISFFTSDLKGEYLIEIEGLTDFGIPVYSTSKFKVK